MAQVRRTVVQTSDPGEAEAQVSRAFPSLRVDAAAEENPFAFSYHNITADRFSVNRMACTGLLRAAGPLPESIAVGRRSAGEIAVRRGRTSVDTSGPFLRPTAPAEFRVQHGEVMLITLQPASVADYLERSGERGSPTSRLETAPHLAAWNLVMDHAGTFLLDADALTPTCETELHDLLCWSLLHAFDDPWAETSRSGARSTALRRALQHLEEHADAAVTMPEAAAAARVSVRTLGLLFRRELDITPYRWLQNARLDRARLDLLRGHGSVAEAAARHGIPHAGRFAAQYHARFGEHPNATLQGAPGSRAT